MTLMTGFGNYKKIMTRNDFEPLWPLSKRKMTASSWGRGERSF